MFFAITHLLVVQVIPLFIMLSGLMANTLIMIIYIRKKFFKKFQSAFSMSFLALSDNAALVTLVIAQSSYLIPQLKTPSVFSCKLLNFLTLYFPSVSCWLMAYISIERVFIIKFRQFRISGNSQKYPLIFIALIHLWNLVVYMDHLILDRLGTYHNMTLNKSECVSHGMITMFVDSTIKVINSMILPFFLMATSSVIIIAHINRIRQKTRRVIRQNNIAMRRDFQFSITIVGLDVLFFFLHGPIFINEFLSDEYAMFKACFQLLYMCHYAYNFFIYLIFCDDFRNEFKRVFIF